MITSAYDAEMVEEVNDAMTPVTLGKQDVGNHNNE